MKQKLFELHNPGTEYGDGQFYIVNMPGYHDKGWYVQGISYDWFRNRELKRAFPDGSDNTARNGMNWMQYAQTVKYCSEREPHPGSTIPEFLKFIGVDINTVPVCNGIWEFYDAIGYDRKRKKYT